MNRPRIGDTLEYKDGRRAVVTSVMTPRLLVMVMGRSWPDRAMAIRSKLGLKWEEQYWEASIVFGDGATGSADVFEVLGESVKVVRYYK